jgi:phosphoglycerate dehydrogenase-like enzyme
MVDLVRGCESLIVGIDPVTEQVLRAGPLRLVVKYGTGLDNIDLAAADRLGVTVTSTPGANSQAVAELTIGMLLGLARHLVFHDRSVRRGSWERKTGFEVVGRLLGVIGYGQVGRRVAHMAAALGMRVVVHDPFVSQAQVELVSLEDLLSTSDVVSLHVPLTGATRGLVDRRALRTMKPGAFLINTARAGLVDEQALAEALADGHLGGAALDDFIEMTPRGSPLFDCDNFLGSPHAGAATVEAAERAGLAALEEVLKEAVS